MKITTAMLAVPENCRIDQSTMYRFSRARVATRLQALGDSVTRSGLVIVLLWIGAMKFTAIEAEAIAPLVDNSPFLRWIYAFMSVRGFAAALGILEIAIAMMIASRAVFPRLSAIGSGIAIAMFVTTLTFIFSTPGWEPSLGGFPAIGVVPGQFLLKDLVLLGVSMRVLGDSLKALRFPRTRDMGAGVA